MISRSSHPSKRCSENMQQIYRKTAIPSDLNKVAKQLYLIKLQSNFIEITLRHGYSPLNLLHIFRTSFTRNASEWMLLDFIVLYYQLLQIFFNKATWFRLSSSLTNFLLNTTLLQYFPWSHSSILFIAITIV